MLFKNNYKSFDSPWMNKIFTGQDPNNQDLLDHLHIIHNRHAGFTEKEAKALLTYAFANNVLESVNIPNLKTRINSLIANKLGVNLGFDL